jgi:hypothetical protein
LVHQASKTFFHPSLRGKVVLGSFLAWLAKVRRFAQLK